VPSATAAPLCVLRRAQTLQHGRGLLPRQAARQQLQSAPPDAPISPLPRVRRDAVLDRPPTVRQASGTCLSYLILPHTCAVTNASRHRRREVRERRSARCRGTLGPVSVVEANRIVRRWGEPRWPPTVGRVAERHMDDRSARGDATRPCDIRRHMGRRPLALGHIEDSQIPRDLPKKGTHGQEKVHGRPGGGLSSDETKGLRPIPRLDRPHLPPRKSALHQGTGPPRGLRQPVTFAHKGDSCHGDGPPSAKRGSELGRDEGGAPDTAVWLGHTSRQQRWPCTKAPGRPEASCLSDALRLNAPPPEQTTICHYSRSPMKSKPSNVRAKPPMSGLYC